MDQNPQNQNNNDLDSLLKEFQSLSTTEGDKPLTPNVASENPAHQTAEPVSVVQPVTPTIESVSIPQSATNVVPDVSTNPQFVEASEVRTTSGDSVNTNNQMPEVFINPALNIDMNPNEEVKSNSEEIDPSVSDSPVINSNKNSNLFIIIILLFIGIFIFFIPQINNLLNKKPGQESKPTPSTTPVPSSPVVSKEITMLCTMPAVVVSDLQNSVVSYKYYYKNNKVVKFEKITNENFTTVNQTNQLVYNEAQTNCSLLATKYAGITGYTANCKEVKNNFVITSAYDLLTFVNPTEMTIGTVKETIKSDVNLNDDIKVIKKTMTDSGATCK